MFSISVNRPEIGCRHCRLVGSSGLEPPTSRLSGARSNHLSYEPIKLSRCISSLSPMVEMMGFEPMTPCLQGRCSPNWATPPYCFGVLFWVSVPFPRKSSSALTVVWRFRHQWTSPRFGSRPCRPVTQNWTTSESYLASVPYLTSRLSWFCST